MKKNKGFTLIEVIATLLITSVMCFAIASFLYSGYKQFELIVDQKRKVDQLRLFRARVTSQFRKLTDDDFLFTDEVPEKQVKFTKWQYEAYCDNGVKTSGVSEWAGLVFRTVAFYTMQIDTVTTSTLNPAFPYRAYKYKRCEYSFQNRQIKYTEWNVAADPDTGALPPIAQIPSDHPTVQQIILNDVNDMQVTSSFRGIPVYEVYPRSTYWDDKKFAVVSSLEDDAVIVPRINNARLKMYIDLANKYVVYKSCLNFSNRNLFVAPSSQYVILQPPYFLSNELLEPNFVEQMTGVGQLIPADDSLIF